MSYFSKKMKVAVALFVGLTCSFVLSGCMSYRPNDTEMPWSAPASWEGTMPLPGGMKDRFE
jgi:ABC-type uncharacterized transport system auxiliary subunit